MALFVMMFRRMLKNKWMGASLFLGLTITVALVSSMPIYTEAILSRMLVKDMERFQTNNGVYPASHWSSFLFTDESKDKRKQITAEADQFMIGEAYDGFGVPVRELVMEKKTESIDIVPDEPKKKDSIKRTADLGMISGMNEHILLKDGRLPAAQPVDGVYEALVTEQMLVKKHFVLGTIFELKSDKLNQTMKIRPVGVFSKKSDDDLYFHSTNLYDYAETFFLDEELFRQDVIRGGLLPLQSNSYFFIFDYSRMELRYVNDFVAMSKQVAEWEKAHAAGYLVTVDVPALDIISRYEERAGNLRVLIWSLNVPVLIMLGFYMFMVANLIADRQKNEIAVLRSRGAAKWQILMSFALEFMILDTLALLAGPWIGMQLTGMLGASNGFLEFVQRSSLPIHLSTEAWRYALGAAACSFLMLLIPAFLATRVSIVGHKQQMARRQKTPIWHKLFLDVALLAAALYGLRAFRMRLNAMQELGLNAGDLKIDPLQFVMPALFVIGAGLFLLRLYPLVLRLVYWIGRRWWPPSLYGALIQVGRAGSQYQFLMVFLIMTIAIGVFSASAARTINSNIEERIFYRNGADVVMTAKWRSDRIEIISEEQMRTQIAGPNADADEVSTKPVHYEEPPFEPYSTLPGVEHAAKVFIKDGVEFSVEKEAGRAKLIGIDTYDFGSSAWLPHDLLDYSYNEYLNLIAGNPKAVLISETLAEQKNIHPGDMMWIGWKGVEPRPFIVYGIIDYFPTFNPNQATGKERIGEVPMLIVGHLERIQRQLALEPYQIWMKMKPDASMEDFYGAMVERNAEAVAITDSRADLADAKNDPFLQAINGVLTMGFIVSIIVSFSGFLLYWVLTLRGRALQNGTLRAIGISFRQLLGMLAAEQLLTSGAAIMIGVLAGNLTSRLFVPNFQTAFDVKAMVPPFRVIFDPADSWRLYGAVSFMLTLGVIILGFMLARMKINQALKLGED